MASAIVATVRRARPRILRARPALSNPRTLCACTPPDVDWQPAEDPAASVCRSKIQGFEFSYDLWGDSVNTASRMESTGRPGRIQITEATRDLVDDEFICEAGGVVDVKGKEEMSVWYLEGRQGEG